jgi:2-phospho-L-lactate guanylyltransferase
VSESDEPEFASARRWVLVVPVRPAGKSRLGVTPEFARAIALDTIAAAAEATLVKAVLVVTSDATLAEALRTDAAVHVVPEPESRGIGTAIARALEGTDVAAPRAVLLGDLPALDPADLDAALTLAGGVARAFVADEEGTGTSLVTADAGVELIAAFGADSAARHRELGLAELTIVSGSTLRRDVDTPEQLEAAAALGLGPRTRALLS